jgi:hypothetical protein
MLAPLCVPVLGVESSASKPGDLMRASFELNERASQRAEAQVMKYQRRKTKECTSINTLTYLLMSLE